MNTCDGCLALATLRGLTFARSVPRRGKLHASDFRAVGEVFGKSRTEQRDERWHNPSLAISLTCAPRFTTCLQASASRAVQAELCAPVKTKLSASIRATPDRHLACAAEQARPNRELCSDSHAQPCSRLQLSNWHVLSEIPSTDNVFHILPCPA